jgi:hypothetical protein
METMEPRRLFSIPALDTSFNSTGEILDTFAGGMHATLVSAKVLPGGKILAVGQGLITPSTRGQTIAFTIPSITRWTITPRAWCS